MKKEFISPFIEIVEILSDEIIVTSSGENDPLNILDREDVDNWY